MRFVLLLLCVALMLLLFSSCQARISEGELSVFSEQVQLVEDSMVIALGTTDVILAEYSLSSPGGVLAREQIRQLRDEVRGQRNELLLLSVPDALHQLKLAYLEAADKAALALQYAAVFAETGDETMFAAWFTTRSQANGKLQSAKSRLNSFILR